MTLTPAPPPTLNSLTGYVGPGPYIGNITPFTYRDGASYLDILADIEKYINSDIVEFVNANTTEIGALWVQNVAALTNAVNLALGSIGTEVDDAQAAATAAETAAALAQTYAGQSASLSDGAMAAVFNNVATAFRIALNAAYASKATETTVTSGRLSAATLDGRFADKADTATITGSLTAMSESIAAIAATAAAKASGATQTTVETGRLSEVALDARFAENASSSVSVKLGGKYAKAPFNYLRSGITNPVQDTRVCLLGSSNINGAHVSKPEKAMAQRLSRRAGAGATKPLDNVVANVTPGGMQWFQGGQGNTTSADYFTTARRTALSKVVPHYVIHMIGENDLYYGTTLANYRANMLSALSFIETVNPAVVNVLVHSHGRHDVPSPVAPWSEYGNVLREVAALNTSNRVFIDTTEFFETIGTQIDNRSALMYDLVHLNDAGHRRMADIISTVLGISVEADYFPAPMVTEFPFVTGPLTYSTDAAIISELFYKAASYPREVKVEGNLWAQCSVTTGYVTIDAYHTDPLPAAIDDAFHVTNGITAPASLNVSGSLYIPPGTTGSIRIRARPSTGNIIVQGSSADLTKVKATFMPV